MDGKPDTIWHRKEFQNFRRFLLLWWAPVSLQLYLVLPVSAFMDEVVNSQDVKGIDYLLLLSRPPSCSQPSAFCSHFWTRCLGRNTHLIGLSNSYLVLITFQIILYPRKHVSACKHAHSQVHLPAPKILSLNNVEVDGVQDKLPQNMALWHTEYFNWSSLRKWQKEAGYSDHLQSSSPEIGHKICMWRVPSLYLKEKSILISEDKGTQK